MAAKNPRRYSQDIESRLPSLSCHTDSANNEIPTPISIRFNYHTWIGRFSLSEVKQRTASLIHTVLDESRNLPCIWGTRSAWT